jgi:broad specificity phosphatase PhoE
LSHSKRTLILVRHAETPYNREGRFQGQTDVPLSDRGRDEARALRDRLAAHTFLFDPRRTLVASSDLSRARETAEIAFGVDGRAVVEDTRLRELAYGVFEGLTPEEIDEHFPGRMAAWHHGDDQVAIEGGESRGQGRARGLDAVQALSSRAEGQEVIVVVTHGGLMRQLIRACFPDRSEPYRVRYHNTATHRLFYDGALLVYDTEM